MGQKQEPWELKKPINKVTFKKRVELSLKMSRTSAGWGEVEPLETSFELHFNWNS